MKTQHLANIVSRLKFKFRGRCSKQRKKNDLLDALLIRRDSRFAVNSVIAPCYKTYKFTYLNDKIGRRQLTRCYIQRREAVKFAADLSNFQPFSTSAFYPYCHWKVDLKCSEAVPFVSSFRITNKVALCYSFIGENDHAKVFFSFE